MEPIHLPALPTGQSPRPEVEHRDAPATAPARTVLSTPSAPVAAQPLILSGKPNFWNLLACFQRRWRLAVSLGLLVGTVAAVAGYYLTSPSSYTAVSLLKVESQTPYILFNSAEGRNNFEIYQRSQLERVKSRMVLNAALREPKVAQLAIVKEQPDPIEWLEKLVQADFSLSPELLRISVTLKESDAALAIVDAIREVFLRDSVNADKTQRLTHLTQLERFYSDYEEQLKSKRASLKKLTDDIGSNDPKFLANRQEFALKELSMLQQQQITLKTEIMRGKLEANDRKQKVQTLEATPIPEEVIEETLKKDPLIIGYRNEIAKLEGSLALWRERAKNPEQEAGYIHDQKALKDAQTGLEARRADQIPKVTTQLRDRLRQRLLREQAEKEDEVAKLSELESALTKRAEERDEFVRGFTKKATSDLSGLNEDIERIGGMAKKFGSQVDALKVESNAPARVTPRDESYVSKREGTGLKVGGAAGAAGFLAMVVGISFLEFLARRVNGVGDVSRGLRLPVVGTMPLVRRRAGAAVKGQGDSAAHQFLIESVDAARTVLLHAARQKNLRVVMITSANAGEGKTLLSAHLSASLARAGWRILLVDGDLRRPSLHKVFGLTGQAGLGEALRGEANIRDLVQPGSIPGLWVISAGNGDARSVRGLAQGQLTGLFDTIKPEYDFIIVDSAPVLPVVDSQLMVSAVDAVILSVLQNVSRLPWVYAAYERLQFFQVDILGAVVHGTSFGAYGAQFPYLPYPPTKPAAASKPE